MQEPEKHWFISTEFLKSIGSSRKPKRKQQFKQKRQLNISSRWKSFFWAFPTDEKFTNFSVWLMRSRQKRKETWKPITTTATSADYKISISHFFSYVFWENKCISLVFCNMNHHPKQFFMILIIGRPIFTQSISNNQLVHRHCRVHQIL